MFVGFVAQRMRVHMGVGEGRGAGGEASVQNGQIFRGGLGQKSQSWEMVIRAVERPRKMSMIRWRASLSRPLVGSSSSRASGRMASTVAREISFFRRRTNGG